MCPDASSACKVAGACQDSDGRCSAETNAADGTACDDGDAGTDSDTCTGGVCAGVAPPPPPAPAPTPPPAPAPSPPPSCFNRYDKDQADEGLPPGCDGFIDAGWTCSEVFCNSCPYSGKCDKSCGLGACDPDEVDKWARRRHIGTRGESQAIAEGHVAKLNDCGDSSYDYNNQSCIDLCDNYPNWHPICDEVRCAKNGCLTTPEAFVTDDQCHSIVFCNINRCCP